VLSERFEVKKSGVFKGQWVLRNQRCPPCLVVFLWEDGWFVSANLGHIQPIPNLCHEAGARLGLPL
jgi:hypothetical protein